MERPKTSSPLDCSRFWSPSGLLPRPSQAWPSRRRAVRFWLPFEAHLASLSLILAYRAQPPRPSPTPTSRPTSPAQPAPVCSRSSDDAFIRHRTHLESLIRVFETHLFRFMKRLKALISIKRSLRKLMRDTLSKRALNKA